MALQSRDVDVWRAELDQADALCTEPYNLLSSDEKERANRFRFDRDKNRFIASRAILRTILSRYSGVEPGSLTFIYGTHGKPELKLQKPYVECTTGGAKPYKRRQKQENR